MQSQLQHSGGVLVVDDDPVFTMLAEATLVGAGHRVATAGDGVEALKLLDRQQFELAVVDLSMPRIDGLRLIGLIRGSAKHQLMRILVVSGTVDSQDCVQAMAMGATATCAKPVDWATFPDIIQAFLPAGSAKTKSRPARSRVLKRGIVAFNGRHSTLECTIRNMSETGCLISSEAHRLIPDTFELLIEIDGQWCRCETVWRRPPQVGVRFVGRAVVAAKKREQIVTHTTPAHHRLRRRQSA